MEGDAKDDMTVPDACREFNLHSGTVRLWAHQGLVVCRQEKGSRRWTVSRASLLARTANGGVRPGRHRYADALDCLRRQLAVVQTKLDQAQKANTLLRAKAKGVKVKGVK